MPRAAFLIGLLLIGQLVLRPVYSTTASDYFFLAALVMTLGGLLFSNRQSGFIPGGIAIGAGMFAVGACASAFSSVAPSASLSVALRVLYITLIWFWLATVLLRRARDVRLGVCLWVISLAVSGTAGFAQLLLGDVIPNTDAAFGRMTGTAQHFNDFGGSGAVALPAAAGLLLLSQAGRSVRLVGAVGTVAIAGGLLLSGSVGGMLAAAVGMSSFAVVARRVRSLWIAAAVVASATLATWHAQASNGAETIVRRINTVSASEGSLNARFEVFRLAWAQIADQPFIGTGFGLDPTTAGGRLPDLIHNAYLGAWYQGGAPGPGWPCDDLPHQPPRRPTNGTRSHGSGRARAGRLACRSVRQLPGLRARRAGTLRPVRLGTRGARPSPEGYPATARSQRPRTSECLGDTPILLEADPPRSICWVPGLLQIGVVPADRSRSASRLFGNLLLICRCQTWRVRLWRACDV